MTSPLNRRTFAKSLAAALAPAFPNLATATPHKIQIGYTCLTWGAVPRSPESLEPALKDISDLGFHSFETFSQILEDWDSKGTLSQLVQLHGVPLRSGYSTTNLTDPSQRKDTLSKVIQWAKVIKKYGGTFLVLAPNSVKGEAYDFAAHRTKIISALNDYATAITDLGLATGLHQHTGTAIETRDQVYAVMDAVNTKYLKFAPDVGQLQKGGADAAKVVRDFLPIVRHMHLKDYNGTGDYEQYFAGYCPLGLGKVDIKGILEMLEKGGHNPDVLVELDRSPNAPTSALDAAKISKAYLQKLGYTFRG
jgi:inosose dehydratase